MKVGPLLPVNSSGLTPVVALSNCRQIRIQEDASQTGWPTADFLIYTPTPNDGPMQLTAGLPHIFPMPNDKRWFNKGDIAGYVKMVTGSTEFAQYEY